MNRYRLALATSRGDPYMRARLTRARGDGTLIASRFRQGGFRGDPFFGAISKALGGAVKFLAGGIGALAPKDPRLSAPNPGGQQLFPSLPRGTGAGGLRLPGSRLDDDIFGTPDFGDVQGGASSTAGRYSVGGGVRRRYRRMNPLNPKALTRAGRRVRKFVDFARSMGALAKSGVVRRAGKRGRKR
jgi:hypothetical protein